MALLAKKVKNKVPVDTSGPKSVARSMLRWYDRHARVLPWRAPVGKKANPYHVWLSEVMLQQTVVAAVIPYFNKFINKWPDLRALAQADLTEVLAAWAGLGYYSRAHRLHECAKILVDQYNAQLPDNEDALLNLPGFGPYTAAAVAAIAFGRKANVVDGNVERVMARLHAVTVPMPEAKSEIRRLAALHLPNRRCGDYAQSLMDLGATICTPRQPDCPACPLRKQCLAYRKGIAADLPQRLQKEQKPLRSAMAFVMIDKENKVYLQRRHPKGLLAGMMEVPSSPWLAKGYDPVEALHRNAPEKAKWQKLSKPVRHVFTHFVLEIDVAVAQLGKKMPPQTAHGIWVNADELDDQALPSVMRRIVLQAYSGLI